MKRIMTVLALALLLAVLVPAAASASPRASNPNGGEVVFTCECGAQVTVWVNFIASDRGGHSPAIVVSGSDARVFKLVSYEVEGDPTVYSTGFPARNMEIVTCTHPLEMDVDGTTVTVTVTLHGVFLP